MRTRIATLLIAAAALGWLRLQRPRPRRRLRQPVRRLLRPLLQRLRIWLALRLRRLGHPDRLRRWLWWLRRLRPAMAATATARPTGAGTTASIIRAPAITFTTATGNRQVWTEAQKRYWTERLQQAQSRNGVTKMPNTRLSREIWNDFHRPQTSTGVTTQSVTRASTSGADPTGPAGPVEQFRSPGRTPG